MHRFLTSLATCLLLAPLAAAARPGDFQVIGPGGGSLMLNPTVSPLDPQTALIASDMTGAYITHDGGNSWRMFNLRGQARFFAFDPHQAKTIYTGGIGLWRSTDNGETWSLVWPKPSAIQSIHMTGDHADERIVAEPNPLGDIVTLAVDPTDSRTLIAATYKGKECALFVSHDSGNSWQKQAALTEVPYRIWAGAGVVYAGGPQGVAEVRGAQVTMHAGPEHITLIDIAAGFPSGGPPVFYATSERGAFLSRDGGATWPDLELPGSGARIRAVGTSRNHPETAYVSYVRLTLDDKMWFGVARTRDTGKTWSLVWKQELALPANVHEGWSTESIDPVWTGIPVAFGVADNDPNLCYATDAARAFRTTDGGDHWDAVYSRRTPGGDWTSTGLDVATSYGVHFDPFDSKRVFMTFSNIGLWRSEDGGSSWTRSLKGVPGQWSNTTYWVEFDPEVKGRMWGVMSFMRDLPRPKMWRKRSPLTYGGGVCRSEDGGRTWRASNAGMDQTAPTHILLDPSSPKNARVLYATGLGRGVYKSTDGGQTWAMRNNGITQKDPLAWRLARAGNGTLYLLIARRSEDGSIGNPNDGAIYKSTDGADSWTPVTLPSGVNGPNGLAVDPHDPQRMYLAAWARATGTHGDGGGIYLSTDGGRTWRVAFDRDRHVYDVTIDPHNAGVLYAAGFESSAWRSTDRGEHWTRIPGFNFKWGHRVIADPADPKKVYITTFGGSVWHGAVDGPDDPVDIATPELQPGR